LVVFSRIKEKFGFRRKLEDETMAPGVVPAE